MKSNSEHTSSRNVPDIHILRSELNKEKEELVSMFLASASLSQLSEQYKLIDELNEKMQNRNSD